MTVYIGLDMGHETVGEADHWLRTLASKLDLPPGTVTACTHLVQAPVPHVAVSLAVSVPLDGTALPPVPPHLAEAAARARAEHTARRSGRAVLYPGVEALTGTLTVAELIEKSAIERVTILGGGATGGEGTGDGTTGGGATGDRLVDTRGFVRPQWMDGALTLVTTPAPGGRLAPFEVPDPTPCCADHAPG